MQTELEKLIEEIKAEAFEEGYHVGWDDAERNRYTCKVDNRHDTASITDKWIDMPEATDKTEIEELADRVDKALALLNEIIVRLQGNLCQVERRLDAYTKNGDISLNELNHKTMQNETEIEMLWNETERIKARMPKEWK